uniref:Uncharacterized protein n=1 Tax=Eptatretus burgeri TaxID=7764 RepID=A0A8C4R2N2_EPTBU
MKRCFLSAGSPASSPSKSRVVEAVCIHLCDKFSTPQKKGGYVSRWKLIISAYNGIRQRLLNSEDLLEGTDLILLVINEATLTKWYKDHTRRGEIKMLMQGLSLPGRRTAKEPLPPAKELPSDPSQPAVPLTFEEPTDTTGQAARRVRRSLSVSEPAATPPPVDPPTPSDPTEESPAQPPVQPMVIQPVASKPASRTTDWRHRKKTGERKERKVYTCRVCNKPITSPGHTQFRGHRYCPDAPNQIPKEEWLVLRRAESKKP